MSQLQLLHFMFPPYRIVSRLSTGQKRAGPSPVSTGPRPGGGEDDTAPHPDEPLFRPPSRPAGRRSSQSGSTASSSSRTARKGVAAPLPCTRWILAWASDRPSDSAIAGNDSPSISRSNYCRNSLFRVCPSGSSCTFCQGAYHSKSCCRFLVKRRC